MWKPVFSTASSSASSGTHPQHRHGRRGAGDLCRGTLTEIHQEGIRIPPTKLVDRGVMNPMLASVMRINVRAPGAELGRPEGADRVARGAASAKSTK